jgi:hypothetical protein
MAASRGGNVVDRRVRISVLAVAVVVLVVLAGAGRARATVTQDLQGPFGVFSNCPINNPLLRKCFVATTTGGELRIGNMMVPVTKTFNVLQGGYGSAAGPEDERMSVFFPPEDGVPIQPTPLPVPGGLTGVLEASLLPSSLRTTVNGFVNTGLGGLTATLELASPNSVVHLSEYNISIEEGVALEMAVKIKLTNPFLGQNCYIGSSSDPVLVQATTGTTSPPAPNKPIQGQSGLLEGFEEDEIIMTLGNTMVANSFAAPVASGCGGSLAPLIDRAIDARLGLPSPAGRNAAIFISTGHGASARGVIAHE